LGRKSRETAELVVPFTEMEATEEEDAVTKQLSVKVIARAQIAYFTFDTIPKFAEWSNKFNSLMKK